MKVISVLLVPQRQSVYLLIRLVEGNQDFLTLHTVVFVHL